MGVEESGHGRNYAMTFGMKMTFRNMMIPIRLMKKGTNLHETETDIQSEQND